MADEIHIVLADDHPVVRKGLKLSIEEGAGLKVVGEAADGEAALALIKNDKPAAFAAMAKWYGITDPRVQEHVYAQAVQLPAKPYPSVEGIKAMSDNAQRAALDLVRHLRQRRISE